MPHGSGLVRRAGSADAGRVETVGHGAASALVPCSVRLSLRWERAGVRRAQPDPLRELTLGPDILRVDSEPSLHPPAAHLHEAGLRRGEEPVRLRRVDANQHAPLAARRDGHVPPDEEGEPAEHLLLGQIGLAAQQCTDPIREFLVVPHGDDRNVTSKSLGRARIRLSGVDLFGRRFRSGSSRFLRPEATQRLLRNAFHEMRSLIPLEGHELNHPHTIGLLADRRDPV
jgi:hypothetical protein